MLAVLGNNIVPIKWGGPFTLRFNFRGIFLDSPDFERQSKDELKKKEEAALDIARESPILEARVLTDKLYLSPSGLVRGVIAEAYQDAVDPSYIKGYPVTSTASNSVMINIDPAKTFSQAGIKPTPNLASSDYTGKISYVHYAGSAPVKVMYTTEQSYESYQEEQAINAYVPQQEAREYPRIPYTAETASYEQETYRTEITATNLMTKSSMPEKQTYTAPIDNLFVVETRLYEPKQIVQERHQLQTNQVAMPRMVQETEPVKLQEAPYQDSSYVLPKPIVLDAMPEVKGVEQPLIPAKTEELTQPEFDESSYTSNEHVTTLNIPTVEPDAQIKTRTIAEPIQTSYSRVEYFEAVQPRLDAEPAATEKTEQLLESQPGFDYQAMLQEQTVSNTNHISDIAVHLELPVQTEYQEDMENKPSDLTYSSSTASVEAATETRRDVEPLEQKVKSNMCFTKPKLNNFMDFEEVKKDDYLETETKTSPCPVRPELKAVDNSSSLEENMAEPLEDKVELKVCPVRPDLKERFYVDANTQVRWFSLFDAPVDITSKLIDNEGDFTIRVKGNGTDFDRPFYESKSAAYIAKANSGVAIVDRLIRQLGLNPVWEVEQELTEDSKVEGKVYLKDIMGVKEAAKADDVDFVIRFYDKKTGQTQLKSLENIISMEDIETERYKIDVVAQARKSASEKTRKEFKEDIDSGYKPPVLGKVVYKEGFERTEPLSGTGGIDEFVPKAGDIYDIVIALQGVYDRESRNIEGAYSALKFKISEKDLMDDSDYLMQVKNQNGFDKIYRTKANRLSAIVDRRLEEYGLKGAFVEIATHKDEEGRAYQIGGELNNTTVYLAGVQGAMTKFLEYDPNASPHEMGILVEKVRYPCGGGRFGEYHNPAAYEQKRRAA